MSGAVLVGDANARGAATSGGVTVPAPTNVAVTPSPLVVQNVEPQTTSAQTPWWLLGVGGLVLAAAVAIAVRRRRSGGSNATAGPAAGT
jgi:hypothetical protein